MVGSYSFSLVVLSWIVASFASFTALDLASRISASKGLSARVWLFGGACSMGTGIWSMHFTGMLAFSLPIPMGYDVLTTLLSMLIAIIVSAFALITVTRDTMSKRHLLIAAVLVGLGISSMHYTGMAAMEVSPPIRYNPWLVAASIAIAIAAALAALWIAFTLRSIAKRLIYAKIGSAVVMGLAIVGMHYTAMAAAGFAADSICTTGSVVDNSWMATAIVLVTFLILCETLVLSVLDSRMASKTARMAASLQEANAELQHMVLHDALTKLPNRLLLEDRIQQAAQEAHRGGSLCAVLFVDLDRFKAVNDSLGHVAGDELLRAVSERLRTAVRLEDTVSRLGGDEFVILLRHVAIADDAALVARKIIDALSQPVRSHGNELRVTCSIGISLYPMHGEAAATLITRADAAMYHVKKSGRNTFRFFEPEMSTFFPQRLVLKNELHKALEEHQFLLHYQPKIDVKSGALTGMEALVRWLHPERGMVSPTEFIPLTEETGLIVPLGHWVLREACLQNKAWQDRGLLKARVAVNISGVQFQHKDLVDSIEAVLRETGLAPRFLELEITESVIMQNAPEAVAMLEKLGQMGVEISIDDFGTGYSSLSYLKRFNINKLKIDQSFIRNISDDKDDAAIVQAIVALAHSLRLRVVAEGVELQEQLDFLYSVGDDEYQGYLHSAPLSAAEFERYLEATGGRTQRPALAATV